MTIPPDKTHLARSTEFVDSSAMLDAGDAQGLRARADDDGYLFFKRLLPAQDVLRVRADALSVIDKHGWRQSRQDALGGLIDAQALSRVLDSEMRVDIGVSHAAYDDMQKLESLHRLPHHPNLLALYRLLLGREVLVHPRHIARMATPHQAMTPTPQHQDFPLIQGSSNTWTCWFPLGDCPRDLGGLTVLRGSHRAGYLPVQQAAGAGAIAAQLCAWENEWVEGDYHAGDVLTFPCYTVHKALACQFKDSIRLSLDVRYQPIDEVVEQNSLQPHCSLSWEEIYADWQSDDLKYYWRDLPLDLTTWDDSFVKPSRRIC